MDDYAYKINAHIRHHANSCMNFIRIILDPETYINHQITLVAVSVLKYVSLGEPCACFYGILISSMADFGTYI